MRKITIVSLALLISVSLSACGQSKTTPAPANQGAGTTTGGGAGTTTGGGAGTVDTAAVYKANCLACHGANLEGGVGLNLQKVGSRLSKDQIEAVITNGRGAMTGFKGRLSDKEIDALGDWLAAKK